MTCHVMIMKVSCQSNAHPFKKSVTVYFLLELFNFSYSCSNFEAYYLLNISFLFQLQFELF